MDKTVLVNFDMDNVCYRGYSTTCMAERSTTDADIYLARLVARGWITFNDAKRWSYEYNDGELVTTVPVLARCLTDLLYKMKKPGTEEPILTKEQTMEGKQSLLEGISMREIREAALATPWSPGLLETVELLKKEGLYLCGYSDGLGPYTCYQMKRLGLDERGYVPAVVRVGDLNDTAWFQEYMLAMDDATLTGISGRYRKTEDFFNRLRGKNIHHGAIAAIDDSGLNIEPLLLPVQQAGGIAIGYRPTDAHRPLFERYSIPVLKGDDLRAFGEIVLDRRTMARYCE